MWQKYKKPLENSERIIKDVEKSRKMTMERAVRLLTVRPRSIEELRVRLMEKNWTNEEIVQTVLKKLEEYNYIDDEKFACEFAASKLRQKPVGRRLLKQTLSNKKLGKETIDEAIAQVYEQMPEEEILATAIAKRLRIKGKPETREDTKKFYDYLMRQGFSYDIIRKKMKEIADRDFEIEEQNSYD